jgi:hypothetical protein
VSEKEDRDDRRSNWSPRRKQDRQIAAIRYRAHAAELRELARAGPLDDRRRWMLELAAEFERLAAELEQFPDIAGAG